MSIISFSFFAFAVIVILAYFILPNRVQWIVVLAANIVFYCAAGTRFILYILISSLISYYLAIKLDEINDIGALILRQADAQDRKRLRKSLLSVKKIICFFAIIVPIGIWIVLKYGNFLISVFNKIVGLLGGTWTLATISWVVPLGMSFYTFHIVGYVVDVYRKKYAAERNFFKYLTFVTFFAHIVQGPFDRFDEVGKSIFASHSFSYERLCQGCARILWGLIKKIVVADVIGTYVTDILNNYRSFSGAQILFALLGYSIQIYADFSGYMDIMCGLTHILGIKLSENFRQPYLARTVEEFWRRWHITLGKWFRDYVFMPVSMGALAQRLGRKARNKWGPKMGKLIPGYVALIFVWSATGLWHGASWSYLAWGYLNLIVIISTMQFGGVYSKLKRKLHIKSESLTYQVFCILRTFFIISLFRVFSTTKDFSTGISILRYSIMNFEFGVFVDSFLNYMSTISLEMIIVCFLIVVIIFVDILHEVKKWDLIKIKCPFIIRNMIYASLLILVIIFAGGDNNLISGFMYANF